MQSPSELPASDKLARLDMRLSKVMQLVGQIEQVCIAARPTGIPSVLAHHRAEFYRAMNDLGGSINAFLDSGPTEDKIKAIKKQIVRPIREMSRKGPFFHHGFHKLRGYPGDFDTIEVIYDNQPAGEDLISLILDDYYLATPPAQAVRNRQAYLVERLRGLVGRLAQRGLNPVHILNLGSGSARELALLAEDPTFAQVADVTCVDLDPAALQFARQRLDGRLDRQVTYVCTNVAHLFENEELRSQPFHIIYAAGLFDYLKSGLAARLIEGCYHLLAPDGVLLIGNFALETCPNDRTLIEWLLDWFLLYRDEADYREIFSRTSFGAENLTIEYEPLRVNLFAVARRR